MEKDEYKVITLNLPDKYCDALEVLVGQGVYPNRSEALRVALKKFLLKELELDKDFESFRKLVEGEELDENPDN